MKLIYVKLSFIWQQQQNTKRVEIESNYKSKYNGNRTE